MLRKVHILRERIANFLKNKSMKATDFRNQEGFSNLAFSVD